MPGNGKRQTGNDNVCGRFRFFVFRFPFYDFSMKTLATDKAPRAIGPYSQAVVSGGLLYASGQIPLDPATGDLVSGDVATCAEQILDNLEAVLAEGGATLADVLKTTVYLTRMEDFPAMNAVYARRFGEHRPARSTVAVASLPKGATLEIDLIARVRA
jgi:2-iminobutanoate/2-iminopropanoate deaminase